MKPYLRWCYKCYRNTEHEVMRNRFGAYIERCAECGHINRTDYNEDGTDMYRSRILPELGATCRAHKLEENSR